MHGYLGSADSFVANGHKSPAVILARNGFEVWLGSSRGTKYSRTHTTLDADVNRKEYWNFDWQEMGQHDLPAFINQILNITNK